MMLAAAGSPAMSRLGTRNPYASSYTSNNRTGFGTTANIPPNCGGAEVDPGGSANHLPKGWFSRGSSAQAIRTGGPGLGAPGQPSSTGCTARDWVTNNLLWIALGVGVILLLLFAGIV